MMASKEDLRQEMRRQRHALSAQHKAHWDEQLNEKLYQWLQRHRPRRVHTYLPLPEEVNLESSLQRMLDQGIQLYAPKTLPQGQLENRPLHSLAAVEYGRYHTRYPATSEVYTGGYDLILVPGLAFDPEGYRVGYGGGYYDRLLAHTPHRHSLALAYPFQRLTKELPREAHDQPVDEVLVPA